MATGTVSWFNPAKGYGFITPEDGGKNVFVHISSIERSGLEALRVGQVVVYTVSNERGEQAVNVQEAGE